MDLSVRSRIPPSPVPTPTQASPLISGLSPQASTGRKVRHALNLFPLDQKKFFLPRDEKILFVSFKLKMRLMSVNPIFPLTISLSLSLSLSLASNHIQTFYEPFLSTPHIQKLPVHISLHIFCYYKGSCRGQVDSMLAFFWSF